jgi:hypothetical protein
MNNQKQLTIAIIGFILPFSAALGVDHSGHNMSAGSTNTNADTVTTCLKPHVTKFSPAHLATVGPGSEFSFVAFNIHKTENISVTVKKIPVEITSEFKDPYYIVKGRLPDSLKNTAARINVKVSGKSSHCETENGWLLKISDN